MAIGWLRNGVWYRSGAKTECPNWCDFLSVDSIQFGSTQLFFTWQLLWFRQSLSLRRCTKTGREGRGDSGWVTKVDEPSTVGFPVKSSWLSPPPYCPFQILISPFTLSQILVWRLFPEERNDNPNQLAVNIETKIYTWVQISWNSLSRISWRQANSESHTESNPGAPKMSLLFLMMQFLFPSHVEFFLG